MKEVDHSVDVDNADRRRFLRKSGALVVATSLPAFYIGGAAAQQPIKIGMVIAKTGPAVDQGADVARGIQLALAQASSKALGRSVELIWLDEPDPQQAVQNITKLIDEQKVVAVLGGMTSANSLAMGKVALRARVPFISVIGAAREITGKDCNPFMFRLSATVPVYARAMAPQLLAAGKKWYFIAGDYAFGEDVITTFSEIVTTAGGTVVGADRVPVATTDYSSFVLKARAARPDVLISGAANVNPILKQVKELGLSGRMLVAGPAVSDTDLWTASPDALGGIIGKTWYYKDPHNSPEDAAFAQAYRAKEGKPPSDRVNTGWLGMRILLAAMERSTNLDPVSITKALEEVQLTDGNLPIAFRKWDHQLLRRIVVGTARANPADKWDTLDVKASSVANAQALDQMYGSKEEVGCRMAPI